jgi:hypothetical protein
MTALTAGAGVYALLIDGSTAEIRAAASDDFDAVPSMHEAMSPGNLLPSVLLPEQARGRA